MNYSTIYDSLIQRARTRKPPIGYNEMHHVVPRSLGGSNDASNLVLLTAKEHYLAHRILAKIKYDDKISAKKMCAAWLLMLAKTPSMPERYKPTSRDYSLAKVVAANGYDWSACTYTFINRLREEFTGTRYEFISYTYDFDRQLNFESLLVKNMSSCDWILKENANDDFYWKTLVLCNGLKRITCFDCDAASLTGTLRGFNDLYAGLMVVYKGWWIESIDGVKTNWPKDGKITKQMGHTQFSIVRNGETFKGTISEISTFLNVPQQISRKLVSCNIPSVWGWDSETKKSERKRPFKRRPSTSHNEFSNTIFKLKNGGDIIVGSGEYFRENYGIEFYDFRIAIDRNFYKIKGFWILSIDGIDLDYNLFSEKKRTQFIAECIPFKWVKNDVVECCTAIELSVKYKIKNSCLNSVINRKQQTTHGWRIEE